MENILEQLWLIIRYFWHNSTVVKAGILLIIFVIFISIFTILYPVIFNKKWLCRKRKEYLRKLVREYAPLNKVKKIYIRVRSYYDLFRYKLIIKNFVSILITILSLVITFSIYELDRTNKEQNTTHKIYLCHNNERSSKRAINNLFEKFSNIHKKICSPINNFWVCKKEISNDALNDLFHSTNNLQHLFIYYSGPKYIVESNLDSLNLSDYFIDKNKSLSLQALVDTIEFLFRQKNIPRSYILIADLFDEKYKIKNESDFEDLFPSSKQFNILFKDFSTLVVINTDSVSETVKSCNCGLWGMKLVENMYFNKKNCSDIVSMVKYTRDEAIKEADEHYRKMTMKSLNEKNIPYSDDTSRINEFKINMNFYYSLDNINEINIEKFDSLENLRNNYIDSIESYLTNINKAADFKDIYKQRIIDSIKKYTSDSAKFRVHKLFPLEAPPRTPNYDEFIELGIEDFMNKIQDNKEYFIGKKSEFKVENYLTRFDISEMKISEIFIGYY